MSEKRNDPADGPTLRPHAYDGIREYDSRLPNWWLYTLYGAILFWLCYWSYYQWLGDGLDGRADIQAAMTRIEATKLAMMAESHVDNAGLWAMSRNPVIIESGRKTFEANCIPCHLASLRGKSEDPKAIGPDLTDQVWIHGGNPVDAYGTVERGVPVKGMPTWGPVLGDRRISEVVAYVFSHHHEGEPIIPSTPEGR